MTRRELVEVISLSRGGAVRVNGLYGYAIDRDVRHTAGEAAPIHDDDPSAVEIGRGSSTDRLARVYGSPRALAVTERMPRSLVPYRRIVILKHRILEMLVRCGQSVKDEKTRFVERYRKRFAGAQGARIEVELLEGERPDAARGVIRREDDVIGVIRMHGEEIEGSSPCEMRGEHVRGRNRRIARDDREGAVHRLGIRRGDVGLPPQTVDRRPETELRVHGDDECGVSERACPSQRQQPPCGVEMRAAG